MKTGKQPHILTTASNLLGISLLIVTGLKISNASINSYADDISLFAALFMLLSCILSYLSMGLETEKLSEKLENLADIFFMAGLLSLFAAICVLTYVIG